jgi:hypothetical protein
MSNTSHPIREHLIGYLLNAVDADERSTIDEHLRQSPELRNELEVLRRSLDPLDGDHGHFDPPVGLAQRCCDFVKSRTEIVPAALSPASTTGAGSVRHRWSWLDLSVAGAIAAAVAVFILPAIYQSHVQSQSTACQKNLQDLGNALASYSEHHGSYYPANPNDPRLNVAGSWGPTLISEGYLPNSSGKTFVSPSADLANDPQFRVLSIEELKRMNDAQLAALLPLLSGDYAFTLGYRERDDGPVQLQRYKHRPRFAVGADKPGPDGTNSPNHGGTGQHVLHDDGNVGFQTTPGSDEHGDNIYKNFKGEVAPGLSSEDAVIAPNGTRTK